MELYKKIFIFLTLMQRCRCTTQLNVTQQAMSDIYSAEHERVSEKTEVVSFPSVPTVPPVYPPATQG